VAVFISLSKTEIPIIDTSCSTTYDKCQLKKFLQRKKFSRNFFNWWFCVVKYQQTAANAVIKS